MVAVVLVNIGQNLDILECKPVQFAAASYAGWEMKREADHEPKIFGLSYWGNQIFTEMGKAAAGAG